MDPPAKVRSLRRPRLLTLIALLGLAGGIALANLSSEPVSSDLIKKLTSKPERAYGWPL